MTITPAKFTRRPSADIEAVRFDGTADSAAEILRWANTSSMTAQAQNSVTSHTGADWTITIYADDNTMKASAGDWIAKGVLGQFYTLPDSIFSATYLVSEDDAPALAEDVDV